MIKNIRIRVAVTQVDAALLHQQGKAKLISTCPIFMNEELFYDLFFEKNEDHECKGDFGDRMDFV